MNIYRKMLDLKKEYKVLQGEYLICDRYEDYLKHREKEDKVFKKYKFFSNYLDAVRELK